jgi:thioredoxin-like negative regulator of GroEL
MLISFATFVTLSLVKREGLAYHVGAWRADALLEKSAKASDAGYWNKAIDSALAAWQLHPGNSGGLRQLFHTTRKQGSLESLAIGRALFLHPNATPEDRIETMRLFFRVGDHVTTAELISKLRREERQSLAVMELNARFLIARQRPLDALQLIDTLRRSRDHAADLLLAADALIQIPSEGNTARHEAQRIIDELFRGPVDPEVAMAAFSLVQRIPAAERDLLRFSMARERLGELAGKVEVPAALWLLADEVQMAMAPHRREEILAAAVSRWSVEQPGDLGDWLLHLGEIDLFLDSIPYETALFNPELLTSHVQARVLAEEWEGALALLDRAPASTDPAMVSGLRGVVWTRRGHQSNANQHWQRAYRHAQLSSGRDSLLRLGRLADLAGNGEFRNLALTEALKRPSPVPLAASDVSFIFSNLVEKNQDADLLRVSLGLLSSQPENPQLLNNVVWLELLQGRANEQRIAQLEYFADRFPSITGLRTTLALAHLATGKKEAALSVLSEMLPGIDGHAADREAPAAADRAVLAYALASNGQHTRAQEVASGVVWDSLMAVERTFFEAALEPDPLAVPRG